jgi:hypothetical protein
MVMTARVTAENYESLKGFCVWFWRHQSLQWQDIGIAADHRPEPILNAFEQRSKAIAREAVRQSIGDIIEQTQSLSSKDVESIDAALAAQGLPTLSQIRIQFWSKIAGIMKRGVVRSETEYYALRNVVEAMPEVERGRAWALLGKFETRKAG